MLEKRFGSYSFIHLLNLVPRASYLHIGNQEGKKPWERGCYLLACDVICKLFVIIEKRTTRKGRRK